MQYMVTVSVAGFVTYNLPSQKMGTMAVDPVCNNADLRHLTPKIVVLSSADMGMKDRENPDVLECHRVEDDQVQPHNKEEQQRLLIKQALTPTEGRKLGNKEKLLFQVSTVLPSPLPPTHPPSPSYHVNLILVNF